MSKHWKRLQVIISAKKITLVLDGSFEEVHPASTSSLDDGEGVVSSEAVAEKKSLERRTLTIVTFSPEERMGLLITWRECFTEFHHQSGPNVIVEITQVQEARHMQDIAPIVKEHHLIHDKLHFSSCSFDDVRRSVREDMRICV